MKKQHREAAEVEATPESSKGAKTPLTVPETNTIPMSIADKLPKSCTNIWINLVGLIGLLLAFYFLRNNPNLSKLQANVITIASYALPIILLEIFFLKPALNASSGIDFKSNQPFTVVRVLQKLFGFYATIGLCFYAYWLFPEYHFSFQNFYGEYWRFLLAIKYWVLLGAIPYFFLVDRFMTEPEDGYWHFGAVLTLQFSKVDWAKVKQHLLGWLVKFFFLALMYIYMTNDIQYIREVNFTSLTGHFPSQYEFFYRSIFMIDVVLATTGYILTLRIFDTHIRSTEPTMLGWVAAIICYQPFWHFFSSQYIPYDQNGITWGAWLSDYEHAYKMWGVSILLLILIYLWATIAFGVRFSNLTHRGILTNGPYRFCKHPAYVAKNLSWWMINVPFLIREGVNDWDRLKYCSMLLLVNLIYFIRAKTEENHLSRDPVYVEYAVKMNEKSMFSWVGFLFPCLRYKPPPEHQRS